MNQLFSQQTNPQTNIFNQQSNNNNSLFNNSVFPQQNSSVNPFSSFPSQTQNSNIPLFNSSNPSAFNQFPSNSNPSNQSIFPVSSFPSSNNVVSGFPSFSSNQWNNNGNNNSEDINIPQIFSEEDYEDNNIINEEKSVFKEMITKKEKIKANKYEIGNIPLYPSL